jgi:PAS domain S-box-containing protein
MKRLYLRLLLLLIVFVAVGGMLQFLPLNSVWQHGLNALLLLVFTALLLVLFKSRLVTPLREIKRSLQLFEQNGGGGVPGARPRLSGEIEEIFAGLDTVFAHLHRQTMETREAKEFLEKLMQTAQAMVIKFDRRMHPIYMNDYGLKKFQIENQNIASLRITDFLEKKFIREILRELKEKDHIVDKETTMVLRTGEKLDASLSLSMIRDPDSRVSGYLAVIADISKRKKAEIN